MVSFIVGFLIGVYTGVMVLCLCAVGHDSSDDQE